MEISTRMKLDEENIYEKVGNEFDSFVCYIYTQKFSKDIHS